ncbi:hypothetical protein GX51_00910 [Blastomyces parvus]|uniref:Uncharacterized protein n=1 Tax=Blastomyces parvus TaxID=2060905 RepID=A0A2B7XJ62_9EURO|nr:hypothetical protein GX51_00910 [Blastomyces parvus]
MQAFRMPRKERSNVADGFWKKFPSKSESFPRYFITPAGQYSPPDTESQDTLPASWAQVIRSMNLHTGGTLSKTSAPDANSRTSAAQKVLPLPILLATSPHLEGTTTHAFRIVVNNSDRPIEFLEAGPASCDIRHTYAWPVCLMPLFTRGPEL